MDLNFKVREHLFLWTSIQRKKSGPASHDPPREWRKNDAKDLSVEKNSRLLPDKNWALEWCSVENRSRTMYMYMYTRKAVAPAKSCLHVQGR